MSGLTYKNAGVDAEAGDALVERIRARMKGKKTPGLVAGVGGFAALISLKEAASAIPGVTLEDPLLVSGTDGVGTKLKLAFQTGQHDTIGIDLVAMCVNDILTTGAYPLFFLDYFGTGKLDGDVADQVLKGIIEGCERAGCGLVGGETAELPGLYKAGEYDLAGFALGVVDREKLIDGRGVKAGDVLLGCSSSGLHSNGFALAQKALFDHGGYALEAIVPEEDRTLGEVLLRPTIIYREAVEILRPVARSFSHITGGGLPGNVPRTLPDGVVARIDRTRWKRPVVFDLIAKAGGIAEDELFRTFNMGIGLVAVVSATDAASSLQTLGEAGIAAQAIGWIEAGQPGEEARVEWA